MVTTPGQYGPMPVYEDDATTPEDDGAGAGDSIRFVINGAPAGLLGPDTAAWTAFGDLWEVNLREARAGSRVLSVQPGWNLISFDLEPHSPAVASVLSGLTGNFRAVQGMTCESGALSYYVDLPPAMNTLQALDGLHGYWIYAFDQSQTSIEGYLLHNDRALALCAGYNLVSYLPDVAMSPSTALASIAGDYDAVLSYDPVSGAQSYYPDLPAGLNSLKTMQPGRGYWIHMLADGVLTYPTP
jgi:hypothetical protein